METAQDHSKHLGEFVRRQRRSAGLSLRLRDVGVRREHLDTLAREAMKQERLLVNNPCPITEADARRLYEAAL